MTHQAAWLEAHYGPVVVTVLGRADGTGDSYELRYTAARGWWCSCDGFQDRDTCAHVVHRPGGRTDAPP